MLRGCIGLGKRKVTQSRDWFYNKYWVEKLPVGKIAAEVGISVTHCNKVIEDFGIERRDCRAGGSGAKQKVSLCKDDLIDLYVNKEMSSSEVGDVLGCHGATVIKRLKKLGIHIRHHNDTKRGKPANNRVILDDDAVINNYMMDFESMSSTALKFSVGVGVIDRVLFENSVEKKPIGECRDFFGENSPNWNPNLTQEERNNRRDMYAQKIWRDKIYERDEYKCQKCGYSGNLNAHHIVGHAQNVTLRWKLDNGVTLCASCHKGFHSTYGIKRFGTDELNEFLDKG